MPTTEAPTSPPGRRPDSLFRRKRVRYEDLESDELLHLIDKLEDERSRARLREGIWISVLAHLVLFWFLAYGPRVLWHQPRVVNPIDKDLKDLTYLDLPPDALQRIKPKTPAPLSDKNRIAQSDHPVLDRKTLEQLQAMRRAGPPLPEPQPQPQPQPQAQAQPPRPEPPTQPLPPTQQAQIEAPQPAPTPPNFNNSQSPGDAIRQAMRGAERGSSGDYGANAPSRHQAMNAGADILSDTMGVDFGPYMQRVIEDTDRSWLPIIPESARPPLDKQGKVGIRFRIYPDGSVKMLGGSLGLESPSGDMSLDRAAWAAITNGMYPPLPKEFKGPFLELRFGFFYNLDPDKPE